MKARFCYALAALALLAAEVCIALFARGFVRGSLGDALAVVLLYCALRAVFQTKPRLLALYVFLFACFAEALQGLRVLRLLGLEHVRWLVLLAGTRFSWGDVLCYFVGCALCGAHEVLRWKRSHPRKMNA